MIYISIKTSYKIHLVLRFKEKSEKGLTFTMQKFKVSTGDVKPRSYLYSNACGCGLGRFNFYKLLSISL